MHSNVLRVAGAAVWCRSCFAFEGSTNCRRLVKAPASRSTKPAKSGFKAQNNPLTVYVNAYEIAKFTGRLDDEHAVAAGQPQPAG